MNKNEVISVLTRAAALYRDNLENQSVLFLYGDSKEIDNCLLREAQGILPFGFFEAAFHRYNFCHLTGVKASGSATSFYKRCLNGRLSYNDIIINKENLAEQKLFILEKMMSIKKTAKMIGDFNNNGAKLYTEKIAGGVHGCIGFKRDKSSNLNVPNTLLQTDIRNNVSQTFKVYAVFSKYISDDKYKIIENIDGRIDFSRHILDKDLTDIIDEALF